MPERYSSILSSPPFVLVPLMSLSPPEKEIMLSLVFLLIHDSVDCRLVWGRLAGTVCLTISLKIGRIFFSLI